MLVILIGEGKMNKIILPPVPSGNYIINDKNEEVSKRLLEIQSQDGEWQIISDSNTQIINPKCINITDDNINIINSKETFVKKAILKEYNIYELIIDKARTIYTLCCLPVYNEKEWIHLNIKKNQITIGRDTSNQICYKNNLVSSIHARIYVNKGRWLLENYDKKFGTFVNSNQVYQKAQILTNGDTVFIMGLKLILIGNSIYINNPAGKMSYNEQDLEPQKQEKQEKIKNTKEDNNYIELYSPNDYFYRSPRISKKLDKEKIKIDSPPSKMDNNNMPLFLSIGSTVIMGVISLVTVISTISKIANGMSSLGENILSLITSIAMMLSMLLIPLLTLKWEKKREQIYEGKRQKRYREYIAMKKAEIAQIKNKQKQILFQT